MYVTACAISVLFTWIGECCCMLGTVAWLCEGFVGVDPADIADRQRRMKASASPVVVWDILLFYLRH